MLSSFYGNIAGYELLSEPDAQVTIAAAGVPFGWRAEPGDRFA